MNNLQQQYFDWMRDQVGGAPRYRKLLSCLNSVPFRYSIDRDGNREGDGISLRYRFGHECGIPGYMVATGLDFTPCSVLEMMVALAIRAERDFMSNAIYGDRTAIWFWEMIDNLGLGRMTDDYYDNDYTMSAIDRFLDRGYAPDGEGGLFHVHRPRRDMRGVEIWSQLMWHLNEILVQ